jgi:hypothetical protein
MAIKRLEEFAKSLSTQTEKEMEVPQDCQSAPVVYIFFLRLVAAPPRDNTNNSIKKEKKEITICPTIMRGGDNKDSSTHRQGSARWNTTFFFLHDAIPSGIFPSISKETRQIHGRKCIRWRLYSVFQQQRMGRIDISKEGTHGEHGIKKRKER